MTASKIIVASATRGFIRSGSIKGISVAKEVSKRKKSFQRFNRCFTQNTMLPNSSKQVTMPSCSVRNIQIFSCEYLFEDVLNTVIKVMQKRCYTGQLKNG